MFKVLIGTAVIATCCAWLATEVNVTTSNVTNTNRTTPPTPNNTSNKTNSKNKNGKEVDEEKFKTIVQWSVFVDRIFRGISLFCATLALSLLCILQLPFSLKFFIHKQLLISYILNNCLFFIQHDDVLFRFAVIRWLCTTCSIVNYYLNSTYFAWMFAEGLNICIKLNSVFNTMSNKTAVILFSLLGWGFPFALYAVLVPIFYDVISTTLYCQPVANKIVSVDGEETTLYYAWIMKGPMAAFIALNTSCFIFILYIVISSVFSKQRKYSSVKKMTTTIRSVLAIYPLLGFSFVFGFFADNRYILMIFPFVNGPQGTLFFIFHVLLDKQVRSAFIKEVFSKQLAGLLLSTTSNGKTMTTTSHVTKSAEFPTGNKVSEPVTKVLSFKDSKIALPIQNPPFGRSPTSSTASLVSDGGGYKHLSPRTANDIHISSCYDNSTFTTRL